MNQRLDLEIWLNIFTGQFQVEGRRRNSGPLSGQSVWEKKERAREREAEEVTEISPLLSGGALIARNSCSLSI